MATKVFHGPPGSYKSSTAMWFEIVPALRAGRVVVTNLQGILTLEEIQRELKEVFPNTARLLRISIGNDTGMLLMRNFFHWLPIGALIFLDEIQDIYPNDKSFKASDYDYKQEGAFNEFLPTEFVDIYHEEQRKIKGNVNIEDYQDDIGESLFDERNYLRYPRTLRECFMRHRHYNWDILLATPDIKEISSFIRSVCEVAYAHSSKDAIPIPYYKRRPRILEHLPKTNGISVGKNDIVTFKKVPLDVFKLYKSTATGKSTKSGAGQSPITPSVIVGFAFVVAYILYMVFFFFDDESPEVDEPLANSLPNEISQSPKASAAPVQVVNASVRTAQKSDGEISPFSFRRASVSVVTAPNNFVALPFGASKMYVNGVNTIYFNKFKVTRDYIFTVYIDGEELSIGSESIIAMGYKIFYKSDCLLELRSNKHSNYIYCEPTRPNEAFNERTDSGAVEMTLM
jgi:zona occludens toxin